MIKLKKLLEKIEIDVKIGDTILVGKFKNKKEIVKKIGTDEHGMPTINGRKAITFRIKSRVNIFDEEKINESPYWIDVEGKHRVNFDDGGYPFGWYKDKAYVGELNTTHYDIQPKEQRLSRGDFSYPGRAFFIPKVITFWWFPKPSALPKMIAELNKVLKEADLPPINFNTWNIEVVADKAGDWARKIKIDWDDNTANRWNAKNVIIPLKLFSGSQKRTSSDVGKSPMLSPLLKTFDKEKLKGIKPGLSDKQKAMSTKYKFSEDIKLTSLVMEGKYDRQVSDLSSIIVKLIKNKGVEYNDDINILNNEIDFNVSVTYDNKFDLAYAVQGFGDDQELELEITVNPLMFPIAWNDFIAEIKDTLRHEIEHVTQHYIKGKPTPGKKISKRGNKVVNYLLSKSEIPAFMAGFHKKAKTKKITMNDAISEFLKPYGIFVLNDVEYAKVESTWIAYGKKQYPIAKWN